MPCVSQTCRQGRDRCSTPWQCGAYQSEAAWDTSGHRVIPLIEPTEAKEQDKPKTRFDLVPKWQIYTAIGVLLAIIFWALPQLS